METQVPTPAAEASGTILVVEDNDQMASILVESLSQIGYTSTSVNNGIEAVICCLKTPVDLVITDVFLPKISGIDLVKIIRAIDPGIKTIAITGYPSEKVKAELQDLKVDAFLTKPFHMGDMLKAVKRAFLESSFTGRSALPRPAVGP